MSTPMMTQFLEGLHGSKLLDNERIEEVLRRPESPEGDVDGIARFLESQGWLTRFQIDEIRQGRGQSLMFAGYRLLDRLPEHPSGAAYKAYHPALQQAVVVRLLNPDWLKPNDELRNYLDRARTASLVSHPNIVNTLDAGLAGETPFIVHELVDGATLISLVNTMGPLPVQLACDYVRQAALGLQAAHERGVFHGDLSPSRLMVTPVIRKMGANGDGQAVSVRPAPNASIKVDSLGLIPQRPPAGQIQPTDTHLLGALHFLPPERVVVALPDLRGDIYGLGAALYFLLAGRPPFSGNSPADVLLHLQHAEPVRIDTLRRDVTALLADLIHRMLSKDPTIRPSSAASIVQYLQPFCQFNQPAKAVEPAAVDAPYAVPVASETDTRPDALPAVMAEVAPPPMADEIRDPMFEPLPEGTSDSQVYGSRGTKGEQDETVEDHHDMFASHHASGPTEPRKPKMTEKEVKKGWTWMIIGACLHLTALTALILYFMKIGPFSDSSSSDDKKPVKSKPNPNQRPQR